MTGFRLIALFSCASLSFGCSMNLNYPVTDLAEDPNGSNRALDSQITSPNAPAAQTTPAEPGEPGAPEAPVLLGLGFGIPEEDRPGLDELAGESEGEGASWYDLTRQAREDRQLGNFEDAQEHLAQAALQLEAEPPSSSRRRAVHGMRARLAADLLSIGRDDDAEALAELLFEEAEDFPEMTGPATVELAAGYAQRRKAAAEEEGLTESQLPLLRIALLASEGERPTQNRLNMAYEVSTQAMNDGDYALARRAIDRAVLDARVVAPADLLQLGSLKIYKTRIALAQGDLITAEASAVAANRVFEEADAAPANRAIAEATLARALARAGDLERARAIAVGAQARLGGDPPLAPHAARTVLAESGRLERIAGDIDAARTFFQDALDIPGVDFDADILLVEQLTEELAAIDGESASATDAN